MNKMQQKQRIFTTISFIYIVCFAFRLIEYFVWRTDQTWVGEAIIHKLIGIAVLVIAVKQLQFTFADIGFSRENSLKNLTKGLAFGLAVFLIAYTVEILMVVSRGDFDSLQLYVSAYAVDQNIGYRTEMVFFLICIIGNIVNVIMEDCIFRGLFIKILEKKYTFLISAFISALFFGVWHMIGPTRNYYDGTMSMGGMIANVIMLVVTSALVGYKFALLTKITGNLFMALGDHFVNNTIVNILHVVSDTGADEFMAVRIGIAQTVSCLAVFIYYFKTCYKKK